MNRMRLLLTNDCVLLRTSFAEGAVPVRAGIAAHLPRPWSAGADRVRAARQDPARPREVARVAVRVALEVVLVLRLRVPERTGRRDLRDDPAGPQARGLDV